MINRRLVTAGVLAGTLTVLSAIIPAAAQWNKPVTVKAGTKTEIHSVGVWNRTYCNQRPVPKVTRMHAQNGTITTSVVTSTFADGPCKDKKGRFIVFFYTPKPGFRGKDSAQINYVMPKAVRTPSRPNLQASGKRISIIVE